MMLLTTDAAVSADAPAERGVVTSEFIDAAPPYPSCHASTLAETRDGLVAAWFGGTAEGDPDVGIWLARHVQGAWTKPVEVADGIQSPGTREPCWNPVLFQPKRGPLLLFYKVGPSPSRWWGMLTESEDGGRTWSVPHRLPAGILGPIKNKPVQLADGDILCPSSTEDHGWRVHFERTADLGNTWQSTGPVNDGQAIGAIQPSLLFHGETQLQAAGRTRQGRVFSIESPDGGKTWGVMTLTDLLNPDSGTDAVTLRDGRFLMVYNPTRHGRSPLSVAVSLDGRAWTPALTLEHGDGEFSYPAVIQTADGLVHITYTWNRTHIRHVVLDPRLLTAAERRPGGWVKYSGNPVLGGTLGTCFDLCALHDGGKYRMWFSWRPKASIALTESVDGIHWSEPQIVLGPAATGWEEDINRPGVVKRADGYHLWYTGQANGRSEIGYATSQDGVHWARRPQPVLRPEQPWEKVAVMCPDVLWDAKTAEYRMWYSGGEQYEPDAIGYATSRDGVHWTRSAVNPVFQADPGQAWEQHKVTACQVVPRDGWFYMFYIGFRDIDHAAIGLARSRDGVTGWQRLPQNPILSPTLGGWDADACYKPYALLDGKMWRLWYNGRHGSVEQIGLATKDGADLGF